MGPIGPSESFVADLLEPRGRAIVRRRSRPRLSRVSPLLGLAMICVVAGSACLAQGMRGTQESQAAPGPDSHRVGPGFRVYSLCEESRHDGANLTTICFSTTALPFELDSLLFGDYSLAPLAGATYYAGSGMILNVSGQSGNVTLMRSDGTDISEVEYLGHSSIVFNGETVYTSTPKASTRFEGTDLLVQDWLKGTWSPEEGVVLERPVGMTIENSEFYLMVFQPSATVPEFGAFPAVAFIAVVGCALFRRLSGRTPN